MRLSGKAPLLLFLACIVAGLTEGARAQLAVGSSGLPPQTFDSAPSGLQWSTLSVGPVAPGGVIASAAQLDNAVQTNAAGRVTVTLPTSSTVPPTASGFAQWNSTGLYLQTRASTNWYTLLMATLRNDTGSNLVSIAVSYDLATAAGTVTEEIPGHRVYYSLTGATGTWVHIPDLNSASGIDNGSKSAVLNLGLWTANTPLYLLWADDNATSAVNEGAYSIDNFAVTTVPVQPGPPVIAVQPQSQTVDFPNVVMFSVSANGTTPLSYRWFKDVSVIDGATNSSYSIKNATVADQGNYFVVVSNSLGTATSSLVSLTVNCAGATPPVIANQSPDQSLDAGGTLSVSVNASGLAPLAYQWYRSGTVLSGATNAVYSKPNAQLADSGIYSASVANCAGSVTSGPIVITVLAPPFLLVGLTNQIWRYNQSGDDLGSAWKEPGYDDSAWPSGRGVFALEDNGFIASLTNTVLSRTNDSGAGIITHYFRTEFILTNELALVSLVASNYFDDGAVVYLNGGEAFRYNMGSGNLAYNALALAANPAGEGVPVISNLPPQLMRQGTNVLAVEVHQNTPTSADVVFGLALLVRNLAPSPPLITQQPSDAIVFSGQALTLSIGLANPGGCHFQWFQNGMALASATNIALQFTNITFTESGRYFVRVSNSYGAVTSSVVAINVIDSEAPLRFVEFTNVWRFDQSGADLGIGWREPDYDDSAWESGSGVLLHSPSGGFPEPENRLLVLTNASGSITTYYFRVHFTLPAGVTNLVLLATNLLDDGAVFYLNGKEAGRVRVNGTVTATTFAEVSPAGGLLHEYLILTPTNLVSGDNVLAVEVHQSSSISSDVVFGMNLRGYGAFDQPIALLAPIAPQTTLEGTPVVFSANVFGAQPFFFQWFRNGLALPGETNKTLHISAAHGADAGNYHFIASNLFSSVTSSVASLTVSPDVAAPEIVTAFVTNGNAGVMIFFSEPVLPVSATNLANYFFSPAVSILDVQLIALDRVLLITERLDIQTNHSLNVVNVFDLADNPNQISPATVPVRLTRVMTATGLLQVRTVFIILMENQSWGAIKDSPECPYINSLLPFASYCESYSSPGNMRRSEPNYIWLEAGTNFGFRQDFGPLVDRIATTNHLSSQLFRADVEWRGYMEDMPYGSTGVSNQNDYLAHHNPFAFFDDVTTNYAYCTNHVRPYAEFADDLAAGRIGRYNFISPNRTNDMRLQLWPTTSARRQGDDWLARELPGILASPAFTNDGAIFIAFDETDYDTNKNIGMILLSPLAKGGGYASYVPYDHSSTLRTMQEIFGVRPYLGAAATASPLNDLFKDFLLILSRSNGAPVVRLENMLPGRTNYVQASSDLVNWLTISTNVATNAIAIIDPGAAGAPQRFYRAIELP